MEIKYEQRIFWQASYAMRWHKKYDLGRRFLLYWWFR